MARGCGRSGWCGRRALALLLDRRLFVTLRTSTNYLPRASPGGCPSLPTVLPAPESLACPQAQTQPGGKLRRSQRGCGAAGPGRWCWISCCRCCDLVVSPAGSVGCGHSGCPVSKDKNKQESGSPSEPVGRVRTSGLNSLGWRHSMCCAYNSFVLVFHVALQGFF